MERTPLEVRAEALRRRSRCYLAAVWVTWGITVLATYVLL